MVTSFLSEGPVQLRRGLIGSYLSFIASATPHLSIIAAQRPSRQCMSAKFMSVIQFYHHRLYLIFLLVAFILY
jgi:hypothetical protein